MPQWPYNKYHHAPRPVTEVHERVVPVLCTLQKGVPQPGQVSHGVVGSGVGYSEGTSQPFGIFDTAVEVNSPNARLPRERLR